MEIKVFCYLANENNVDHVLKITDSELKGKDDNQAVDYIFDNYVMPYVNAHMVVSYDVSQSFPDFPGAVKVNRDTERIFMLKELYFKNNLRKFRIREGLSQKELAELVGVSRNTIASIEYGVSCPSAKLAAMLCVAVGCSFEELFTLASGL